MTDLRVDTDYLVDRLVELLGTPSPSGDTAAAIALVEKTLRKGGYNTIDLDTVDRGLRAQGFSQGGQLKRAKPRQFAKWLGAQRLLYGHISHFDEIMLGIYGRRHVAGKLWLWDKNEKRRLWSSNQPAINESPIATDGGQGLGQLAGQLLFGLAERMIGKPLGIESAQFVRQNLETLPLKP